MCASRVRTGGGEGQVGSALTTEQRACGGAQSHDSEIVT